MAQRRMFAKSIVDSDAFLDMPLSTQALYFHLGMRADDDGFIDNARRVLRMVGAAEDDMRLLMAKQFVFSFESGVFVLRHWNAHNLIQKDRRKNTVYLAEKSRLTVDNGGAYTMDTTCIQNVSSLDTQVSIDKAREVEASLVEDNTSIEVAPTAAKSSRKKKGDADYMAFLGAYNSICYAMPQVLKLTAKRKGAIDAFLKELSLADFEQACQAMAASRWHNGDNDRQRVGNFDYIIKPEKAITLAEKAGITPAAAKQEKSDRAVIELLEREENGTSSNLSTFAHELFSI